MSIKSIGIDFGTVRGIGIGLAKLVLSVSVAYSIVCYEFGMMEYYPLGQKQNGIFIAQCKQQNDAFFCET